MIACDINTIICTGCHNELPATIDYFYKEKKGLYGFHSRCKKCCSAAGIIYRIKNRDQIRQQNKNWRISHKIECKLYREINQDKIRWSKIHILYHLGRDWQEAKFLWEQMLKDQNGCCACCGKQLINRICVDHCHTTGEIRGLLCDKCNRAVGTVEKHQKLVNKYLKGANYEDYSR